MWLAFLMYSASSAEIVYSRVVGFGVKSRSVLSDNHSLSREV